MDDKIELSRQNIVTYLEYLNEKLKLKDMQGEISMVGGAVMCLAFDARQSTFDIDAVFKPTKEIETCAKEVAIEHGLQPLWLNDICYQFLSERGKFKEYKNFSNLKIYIAQPEYMLAMKCLSARISNPYELDDIKFLINYLNLTTLERVYEVITEFYNIHEFPDRLSLLLNEILSK